MILWFISTKEVMFLLPFVRLHLSVGKITRLSIHVFDQSFRYFCCVMY